MVKTKFTLFGYCFLIVSAGLLAACGGTSPGEQALDTVPLSTQFEQYMRVSQPSFSGTILVAQKGKILLSQGYGLAEQEFDVPNAPQTKFAIGSMTKAFTAMAIMMLQEQGKLTVQDPICQYLSGCPVGWESITLHHLLAHTSGIYNYTDLYSGPNDAVNICREYKPEEVIAYFKGLPLGFVPGSLWSYSNSGYFLLGVVIEKVSGESYETFIQKNIFQPLGMTESGYDRSSTIVKNHASGYSQDQTGSQLVNTSCWDVSLKYAAAGLYSTVGDLYKWDQALYTDQLVSEDSLSTIFTTNISVGSGSKGYGYGWEISQQGGPRVIEHAGEVNGFVSNLARYPDDQVTIVVLSNWDLVDPTQISYGLANIVFEEK